MNDFSGLYEVRDFKPEDKNFILASFLRGVYYGDSWFSLIPKDVFMDYFHPFAEQLLKLPTTIVKVACLPEDNDIILGYSILGHNYTTIHWVFVKKMWRKKGIGRALTPARPDVVTHLSLTGKSLLPKIPTAIFNPFKVK